MSRLNSTGREKGNGFKSLTKVSAEIIRQPNVIERATMPNYYGNVCVCNNVKRNHNTDRT